MRNVQTTACRAHGTLLALLLLLVHCRVCCRVRLFCNGYTLYAGGGQDVVKKCSGYLAGVSIASPTLARNESKVKDGV
jgi:hypothetical protein